ncbi:MAG: spore germination protein [Eubacteriales bacterium]|nr:spore germination protein [Eubacteriales bacterium]
MDKNSIQELCGYITQVFSKCDDFLERRINSENSSVYICYFKGITQRDYISEKIIKPMLENLTALDNFNGNFETLLQCATLKYPPDSSSVSESLLRGEVLIAIEKPGEKKLYTVLANAQFTIGRSINEPTSDVTIKGPKAGFVEDAETNVTELRRYIRSTSFKFISLNLGDVSGTKILLGYIEGRADQKVVDELKNKIESASATGIVDSGNIEMITDTRKVPIFPIMGSSEKVDKVASKLLSGRVAVIVDGSPFVLTAPYVFAESIQSSEDYLRSPYYATFIRTLRFLALITALYLPALLITIITSHNELLPEVMVKTIEEMRADMPFSLFWEVVIVLLIFEMLREVGVRMPRAAGDAIGIVGSLILGDAAVQAGIASPVVIIAVAMAAVCAFIVPTYMYSTVILRFVFSFIANTLGFYGLILATLMVLYIMSTTNSYGSSYMSPIAPFDKAGMEDFIYAEPRKTLGRKEKP